MVKIRVHGEETEVLEAVEVLKKDLELLSVSRPYPDRNKGEKQYCLLYTSNLSSACSKEFLSNRVFRTDVSKNREGIN